jgi:hypothetical protein
VVIVGQSSLNSCSASQRELTNARSDPYVPAQNHPIASAIIPNGASRAKIEPPLLGVPFSIGFQI